jgi:hypothetical protein
VTWFLGLDKIVRRVLAGVALFCLLAVIIVTMSWCSERGRADREHAGRTFADARTGAAQDENKAAATRSAEHREINEKVGAGTDGIRKAPDRVSAGRATLRSLCALDSSDPQCRVLDAR